MKKEQKIMIVTIAIMSLILVCVMFMQFKMVNQTDITQIEEMREDELQAALTEWKEKYEDAEKRLKETNQTIKDYEESLQSNQETKELVEKELAEAKKNFGITAVSGDGIIVTLTDNDEKTYQARDLVELLNELKAAGAEAISINDERVTNITDVVDISTRYILVNSNKISSPYHVKAIGDRTYLRSALSIKNGYFDMKQKEGYSIDIQEKTNLKMNPYSKEVNLRFIELS